MTTKLRKKYDWIIITGYIFIFAVCIFMIVYPLATMKKFKIGIFDMIFMILSGIVLTYFMFNLFSIKYYADDKHLYVKSGFNGGRLELKKIVEVNHKRKFFSSTITAAHCIEIVYSPYGSSADLRNVYISVKDEEQLFEIIKSKAKRVKFN